MPNADSLSLSELAPIKLNLFLHIIGKRNDGYHNLESLFVFADIGDTITWLGDDSELRLSVDGPFAAQTPLDSSNLVLRAARRLNPDATGHLLLTKNIPVASGLGGGSADSAATLRLLNRVWHLGHHHEALAVLGQPLGADVPACVLSQPCYVSGIGDVLASATSVSSLPCIIINPLVQLSTPDVFKAYAMRQAPYASPISPWPPAKTVLPHTINDLQVDACGKLPEIHCILDDLERQPGCLMARMSGSGASCFGIFNAHEAAICGHKSILREHPEYWNVLTYVHIPNVTL